jgi:ParB family transcriptional regulator, chromosome partitioning protein
VGPDKIRIKSVIFSQYGNNIIYFLAKEQVLQTMFSASNLLLGIIEEIDVHKINQPDSTLYGLERSESGELINSIKQNGLLQPIIVRTKGDFFEIVAGCRRYRACRALGMRKIICHVVELDDKAAFEVSLTENIQRKSLDPVEEARAFKAYVDDFGWGGLTELASKISKSTAYVCKRLSLLDLPAELIESVRKCEISPSTAEELIPLKDPEKRSQIAEIIIDNHCSSRQARILVETNQKSRNDVNGKTLAGDSPYNQDRIIDIELKAQRSFDKSITALKIAMGKIATILEAVEDNWIVYEILMQHKNMLNAQIDVLIREKRRLR